MDANNKPNTVRALHKSQRVEDEPDTNYNVEKSVEAQEQIRTVAQEPCTLSLPGYRPVPGAVAEGADAAWCRAARPMAFEDHWEDLMSL